MRDRNRRFRSRKQTNEMRHKAERGLFLNDERANERRKPSSKIHHVEEHAGVRRVMSKVFFFPREMTTDKT